MAFAHYLAAAAPVKTSKPHLKSSILAPPLPTSLLSLGLSSISDELKVPKLSFFSKLTRTVKKGEPPFLPSPFYLIPILMGIAFSVSPPFVFLHFSSD